MTPDRGGGEDEIVVRLQKVRPGQVGRATSRLLLPALLLLLLLWHETGLCLYSKKIGDCGSALLLLLVLLVLLRLRAERDVSRRRVCEVVVAGIQVKVNV